jgi:hypothetical protein
MGSASMLMIATQDHHPRTGNSLYHDEWPEPKFHPRYTASIQRIGEFPSLSDLTVHFDRHGAANPDNVFQHLFFQIERLEGIVRSVQENIRHVAVRHYQNPQDPAEGGDNELNKQLYMPQFLSKVAAASSLRLSVKHAEMHPGTGTTYRVSCPTLQYLVRSCCTLCYPQRSNVVLSLCT